MTLRPGKLPAPMLARLLARITHRDPRVIIGPGIGRDAAVIDLGGTVLVAKSDPVTFATDLIGWYAVNVNANDVACMGARPAWFMATALLPPGAPGSLPGEIFDQLCRACDALQIELVGGHTEVTVGLDRPIIVGAMLGEAARGEIIGGESVQPGDCVLLTKGIAVEGTALLAREEPALLAARGVDDATVARARDMLFTPGISVVPDAGAIRAATRPRVLHDPTEGGLTTALYEMAEVAGMTLRVDPAAAPVFDETRTICDALGLDPMGLLASGALLAIVPEHDRAAVIAACHTDNIDCHTIGTVEAGPVRVIIGAEDSTAPLPPFARDELARFYERETEADNQKMPQSPEGS
jgi:hydrogenase maturation factor